MKPDAFDKNGLAETPAEKSGPPAWLGPALLEARCKDLANAGHRLAKCAECGYLLYEVEGEFIHEDSRAPLHVGVPVEIFDPAKNPPGAAMDGCSATPWKPTVRERIARFIFPKRYVGAFPEAALSSAVDWTKGDVLTTTVWVDVSFLDLLRLLCSRRLMVEVKTACELKPGRTASLSAISVLPPQFLEPGPSGNWSPEDERDLFDTLAGMEKTEIVETGYVGRPVHEAEHPCAECHHPDCFKGYLPGRFGEPSMGDACPECLAAGRLEVRDDGWKMTPRELALMRAATGDHVGGAFVIRDGQTVWAPAGGPVQAVGPQSSSGEPGAEGWAGCAHPDCRNGALTTGGPCPVCRRHLAPMGAVWKPTPPGTACAACGELIVNEACRCGIRGPNGPGPHPDGVLFGECAECKRLGLPRCVCGEQSEEG